MKQLLLKWLYVNSATEKTMTYMKFEELFNVKDYVKKPLTEHIITQEFADTLTDSMFIDLLKTDHFLMLFLFPIGDIDIFLNKVGFNKSDRLVYKHESGFLLMVSTYLSSHKKKGYYLSLLNYPNDVKRMSFDFEHAYRIDVSYKSLDNQYSTGSYPINFEYIVTLDKDTPHTETYTIKSIKHSTGLFNLNHADLHTLDSLKTFAHKLDYNIHRIDEEQVSSITIDDKVFNNVSLFDVVYIIAEDSTGVRTFTLSDILQICGFSMDRLVGRNIEHFMSIENIFNEDELKVIEMTYI